MDSIGVCSDINDRPILTSKDPWSDSLSIDSFNPISTDNVLTNTIKKDMITMQFSPSSSDQNLGVESSSETDISPVRPNSPCNALKRPCTFSDDDDSEFQNRKKRLALENETHLSLNTTADVLHNGDVSLSTYKIQNGVQSQGPYIYKSVEDDGESPGCNDKLSRMIEMSCVEKLSCDIPVNNEKTLADEFAEFMASSLVSPSHSMEEGRSSITISDKKCNGSANLAEDDAELNAKELDSSEVSRVIVISLSDSESSNNLASSDCGTVIASCAVQNEIRDTSSGSTKALLEQSEDVFDTNVLDGGTSNVDELEVDHVSDVGSMITITGVVTLNEHFNDSADDNDTTKDDGICEVEEGTETTEDSNNLADNFRANANNPISNLAIVQAESAGSESICLLNDDSGVINDIIGSGSQQSEAMIDTSDQSKSAVVEVAKNGTAEVDQNEKPNICVVDKSDVLEKTENCPEDYTVPSSEKPTSADAKFDELHNDSVDIPQNRQHAVGADDEPFYIDECIDDDIPILKERPPSVNDSVKEAGEKPSGSRLNPLPCTSTTQTYNIVDLDLGVEDVGTVNNSQSANGLLHSENEIASNDSERSLRRSSRKIPQPERASTVIEIVVKESPWKSGKQRVTQSGTVRTSSSGYGQENAPQSVTPQNARPLGKFLMDIGLQIVSKQIYKDLINIQKYRMRSNDTEPDRQLLDKLTVSHKNLIEKNRAYGCGKPLRCRCLFQCHSNNVLEHHREQGVVEGSGNSSIYHCCYCVGSDADTLYRREYLLVRHMKTKHLRDYKGVRQREKHECYYCSFVTNQLPTIIMHRRTCIRQFQLKRNLEPTGDDGDIPLVTVLRNYALVPITQSIQTRKMVPITQSIQPRKMVPITQSIQPRKTQAFQFAANAAPIRVDDVRPKQKVGTQIRIEDDRPKQKQVVVLPKQIARLPSSLKPGGAYVRENELMSPLLMNGNLRLPALCSSTGVTPVFTRAPVSQVRAKTITPIVIAPMVASIRAAVPIPSTMKVSISSNY